MEGQDRTQSGIREVATGQNQCLEWWIRQLRS